MNLRLALACILLATAISMDQFDSSVRLTYASLAKIINPGSNLIVHSHEVMFGRGGVMSVTGYAIDDLGSYWQINQAYQKSSKTYRDSVRCGDIITISSTIIGYYLRVEETQFGLTTELIPMVHGMSKDNLDEKINWQIHCVDKTEGEEIHYNDLIRLKHHVTGKYVSLDPVYAYTEANCGRGCSIANQIELHAIDNHDDATTVFQIKSGLSFDGSLVEASE